MKLNNIEHLQRAHSVLLILGGASICKICSAACNGITQHVLEKGASYHYTWRRPSGAVTELHGNA